MPGCPDAGIPGLKNRQDSLFSPSQNYYLSLVGIIPAGQKFRGAKFRVSLPVTYYFPPMPVSR
ncbi:hypothetical protein [Kamptonema formosum]|uniref:hypothetical protein n=1 Tax=Kamptonema formosum TaxID=331992 RepID=UPI0003477F23|nr:hypothetical protein [Oscillatoria sp. PCC 10802]